MNKANAGRGALGLALLLLVAAGCSTDSASKDAESGANPRAMATMPPEQQQRIREAGQAHQTGGRVRAQLMQGKRVNP